jgi:hypothetical protein
MTPCDPSVTPKSDSHAHQRAGDRYFAGAGGGNRTPDIQLGKLTFYL